MRFELVMLLPDSSSSYLWNKKSADLPYSDTGLAQPLQSYSGICTLWMQLQRIVVFALYSLVEVLVRVRGLSK